MLSFLNYLTIALLPVYLIKIPFAIGGSLNLLDIFLITSITCNLFFIIKEGYFIKFTKLNTYIKVALFLFIFGYLFSLLVNYNKASFLDSAGMFKSFILLPILFSLTVSFLVFKKKLLIKYLLFSFVFMTTILSIIGFIYFFLDILTFDNRLEIFFNSPNALAMLLGPGILILIFFLNKFNGRFYAFFLILLFFHSFSTIATSSFGCLLSLFILLIIFLFIKLVKIDITKIYLIFIISLLSLSIFLLFLLPITKFLPYSQNIPPSFYSRIVIYDVTRQILLKESFDGVGLGNFQKHYLLQQIYNIPYPQWAVPHPHNNFLLVLVEGGFLAFLGYIMLIFKRPLFKKTPFGILTVFLFFYFIIHGIVDTTIWKNDLAVIFWLFFGLLNFYRQ